MNRRLYQAFTWLMWLAVPLTALRYWQAWDRLPARMATHFNVANQPNGWMPREVSLWFALGLTAFLATIFTVVLYVAHRKEQLDRTSWALLAFFYLVMGLVYTVNAGIVDFSLYQRPMNVTPMLIAIPIGVVVLIGVFLATQRGVPLPTTDLLAQETHGAPVAGVFLAFALLVEVVIAASVPIAAARFAVVIVGLVLLATAGMAWSGFQYCFTQHGLEIRTLGFRLSSIPSSQIKEYAIRPWSPLCGYGIRGIGSRRAYVWGNQGVLIKTSSGEIFLGHRDPERIVHDLDTMMTYSHS